MIYLTLDTDSWLYLLSGLDDGEYNMLEELLFWIERGEVKCILPENIKTEWERNKAKKVLQIRNALADYQKSHAAFIKANKVLREAVDPDRFDLTAQQRIAKLDTIFSSCEVAHVTEDILVQAGRMNLSEMAPNHSQDSFRDTVNILSLIKFIKAKGYATCHFVTENYTDFSDTNKPSRLHPQLTQLFDEVGLTYTYKIYVFLNRNRSSFSSYRDYLVKQKSKEDVEEIKDLAQVPFVHENLDNEYLDHLPYIDRILSKKNPTSFERNLLHTLMQSHSSYKRYVFSKMRVE